MANHGYHVATGGDETSGWMRPYWNQESDRDHFDSRSVGSQDTLRHYPYDDEDYLPVRHRAYANYDEMEHKQQYPRASYWNQGLHSYGEERKNSSTMYMRGQWEDEMDYRGDESTWLRPCGSQEHRVRTSESRAVRPQGTMDYTLQRRMLNRECLCMMMKDESFSINVMEVADIDSLVVKGVQMEEREMRGIQTSSVVQWI